MNKYDAINSLNDLAADLDDIQQDLQSITGKMGKFRRFLFLSLVQKQIDRTVNRLQRKINQEEAVLRSQKVGTT